VSPQQKAQISARLARVAAERAQKLLPAAPVRGPYGITKADINAFPADALALKQIKARIDKEAEAVNAQPVNAQPYRSGSKHPPGYMTAYMRKRRAK
jgi:hypothetical protein